MEDADGTLRENAGDAGESGTLARGATAMGVTSGSTSFAFAASDTRANDAGDEHDKHDKKRAR